MANKRNQLGQKKGHEHKGRQSQKNMHSRVKHLKRLIMKLYQTAHEANPRGDIISGYGYSVVQRLTNAQPTVRGSSTLAEKVEYLENAYQEALASAAEDIRRVQGASDIAGGVGMELELEGG